MIYRRILLILLLHSAAFCSVTFTNLTGGGSIAGTTSYTTASVTPTANKIVMLATTSHLASGNGPQPVSSVASSGLTWTFILGLDSGLVVGSSRANRLEIWCGVGASPSAGAVTITWSTSPTATSWSVDQSTGAANTCATAVKNPVSNAANSATASPLTVSVTFGASTSATYAAGYTDATETISAGTSMTDLGGNNGNSNSIETEYATGNVTPATFTYTGGNVRWGIIAVEVAVPPLSGSRAPLMIQ